MSLSLIITGIIVLVIGLILWKVNLRNTITPTLGWIITVIGAVIIIIGIILLAFSMAL